MPISRAIRRLLHVLQLKEEQAKAALEVALSDLMRMRAALSAADERDRAGRRLVAASAQSNRLAGLDAMIDRLAGLEETRAACRHRAALTPGIAKAELDVAARREQFLTIRIERRQVETIIRENEAADALEAERRGQRALDDRFLSTAHGAKGDGSDALRQGKHRVPQAELE